MLLSLLKICCLLSLFFNVDSLKILVFNPKFGGSHVGFMGKIADTLADAGHEVVSSYFKIPRICQFPILVIDLSTNTEISKRSSKSHFGYWFWDSGF